MYSFHSTISFFFWSYLVSIRQQSVHYWPDFVSSIAYSNVDYECNYHLMSVNILIQFSNEFICTHRSFCFYCIKIYITRKHSMLYRCYCFNYTCMFFFLDGYRLLTSFSHSFRFFPFCNYNGIYMNIQGVAFFTFLIGVEYVIVSAASLLPVVFSSGFFFLDLDDKIVSAPLITHRYRDLGRAPYRTGRSQQVSSPEILQVFCFDEIWSILSYYS